MPLPSIPNLPSGEKMYDVGGAAPDQPEDLDYMSIPALEQGGLKPDAERMKANKYKIDYGKKTQRIGSKTYEKGNGSTREELASNEQVPEQSAIDRSSAGRSLGFEYQQPALGRIGYESKARPLR
jgi:hypothetical protein